MIILRNKIFSKRKKNKKRDEESPKDANIMTKAGTVGLTTAGALGLAAGIEGGRALSDAPSLLKDIKEIKALKDNKAIRADVKRRLQNNIYLHASGIDDKIIDKVRWIEKNPPKFSKIDRINKSWNYLNKGSKLSRTVLGNADTYTKLGIESLKDKHKNSLTKEELELLDKVPKSVKKGSRMLLRWKNARALGRAAKISSAAGGLLYLNGRALQEGSGIPTTSTKPK